MRHLLGVPRQLVQHSTKKSSGALRVRNAAEASSVVCGQHVGSCGCACSLQLSVNEPGHVTHAAFDVKQLVLRPDGSPLRTPRGRLLAKQCECGTIKGLMRITAGRALGLTLDGAQNRLTFSGRASESFHRSIARQLELGPRGRTCLRTLEDTILATLTTHQLNPRRTQPVQFKRGRQTADIAVEGEHDFREQYAA